MDEAAVQAAIAKAVKDARDSVTAEFAAKVDGLKAQLDTSSAETVKARAQAHRFAVLGPFEAAIKGGLINAAAKDQFVKTFGVDDDGKVMTLSVKTAEEFIDGVKDVPKFKGPGAPKRSFAAATDDGPPAGATTAQVMTFESERIATKRGGKPTCFADMEAATKIVLSTNKSLAEQYMQDPNAVYEAPAAS